MASVLVVDDDPNVRTLFQRILTNIGHQVDTADGIEALYEKLDLNNYEVLLLDVHLPDGRGDQILPELLSRDPFLAVIMISGDLSVDIAVSATKNGAFHYLTKPFSTDALQHHVSQALEARRIKISKVAQERANLKPVSSGKRLIGGSAQICSVNLLIDRIAKTPSTPVLISGESGTGKEMVAQLIHELSERRGKPLVKLNCASIPRPLIEAELFGSERGAFTDSKDVRKGFFELADGGTIFLDEIGELDLAVQPKLLRVLEDRQVTRIGGERPRQVDVRIIAATNRDLKAMCAAGEFREDLYFRLAVMTVQLPPLREHREDIEALSYMFLREKSAELGKRVSGFSEDVLDFFRSYYWPGNVRELKNMVERLIILADSDMIELDEEAISRYCFQAGPNHQQAGAFMSTPTGGGSDLGGKDVLPLEEVEKRYLKRALRMTSFNKTRCASSLGISRSTLQRKLQVYGLEEWVSAHRADSTLTD